MGNVGPDYKYGWGRVNVYRSFKTMQQNRFIIDSVSNGITNTHTLAIPANVKEVKVMVYWHDYEANPIASKSLVNNIDMRLTHNATNYYPYVLSYFPHNDSLDKPAAKGVDSINNVEQVSILNPASGNYTINITGKTIPFGPQPYVIVYDFYYNEIKLAYPNGGESFIPGDTARLYWSSYGTQSPYTIEYSLNNGSTWNTVATNVPANTRSYFWPIPATVVGDALLKISNAITSDTCDHSFSIITTPKNITIDQVCPSHIALKWDTVSGAVEYEVYKLGNYYMDSVGRTSGTTFNIPISNINDTSWFSVASVPSSLYYNKGKRAIAVPYYGTGIYNCLSTGINFGEEDVFLSVFPNPANEQLNLNIHLPETLSSIVEIEIRNTLGQLVWTKKKNVASTNFTELISTENFNKGMYIVIVKTSSGNISNRFIIN